MDPRISDLLEGIQRGQQEILAAQRETMDFLRTEAETTRAVREQAFAAQRQAMSRVKRVTAAAVPLLVVCAFLVVYLIAKYRIL